MLKFEDILKIEDYKKIRKKVFNTIKKYKLIEEKDKIVLALSGGKDSSVLALLLKDYIENVLRKKVEDTLLALYIDVGVKQHKKQKKVVEEISNFYDIPLKIEEAPIKLDELVRENSITNVCRICGIQKRYLMLKTTIKEGFNTIATGHNLNDEAETFLMNVLQNNYIAARENYLVKKIGSFPKRIKPLYFISSEETGKVAIKLGLCENTKKECPYSVNSFRNLVRTFLEECIKWDKNILYKIINFQLTFLENINKISKKENKKRFSLICKKCGLPSSKEICKFCEIIEKYKSNME